MMNQIRISLCIDGGYDAKVNTYYDKVHWRQSPLSFNGLKNFVRKEVAKRERIAETNCVMVEGHYFRGWHMRRQSGFEEVWDIQTALIEADITAHYQPIIGGREKGTDSSLAVKVQDLVVSHKVDLIALYAGDSDHLPIIRYCIASGVRILLLGWDFEYTDTAGEKQTTRTSCDVRGAVTYSLNMTTLIENLKHHSDPSLDGIFMEPRVVLAQPHIAGKIYSQPYDSNFPAA